MADARKERDSIIKLVRYNLIRLRTVDPENELLAFSECLDQASPPEAFCERFGGARIPACFRDNGFAEAVMYNNYLSDIRKALGEPLLLFAK